MATPIVMAPPSQRAAGQRALLHGIGIGTGASLRPCTQVVRIVSGLRRGTRIEARRIVVLQWRHLRNLGVDADVGF
jgi:hypothetical protein